MPSFWRTSFFQYREILITAINRPSLPDLFPIQPRFDPHDQVLVNGQVWKDPPLLRHKANSFHSNLMGFLAGNFHSFVLNRPACSRSQAHNGPEGGGFPHAVTAQKTHHLSLPYLEDNIEKDGAFSIVRIDLAKFQHLNCLRGRLP